MAEEGSKPAFDAKAIVREMIAGAAGVITVGGDEVDVGKITALTIGDKRRFFKASGINLSNASRFTPEEEFQYALYLVRKVRPQTTEEELEAVDLTGLMEVSLQMMRVEGRMLVRPTSAPLPTSPGGTAGVPETSTG